MSTVALPRSTVQRPKALAALPPFPSVARKLLATISKENCTIPEITQLIRTDAVFTGEVLRLANSAILGLRYEVASILHAVSVLGMERLKALVLTVGMRDFLRGAKQNQHLRQCWRHQLAVALVAEFLAEPCWVDRSVCYTAGLLHDLGKLALNCLHPGRYAEVQQRHSNGEALLAVEREAFGTDHCEAARCLASDWGLPPQLSDVVCMEEVPSSASGDLLKVIAAACATGDRLGFPAFGEPPEWSAAGLQEGLPQESWVRVNERLAELRETVPFKINWFECEFLRA